MILEYILYQIGQQAPRIRGYASGILGKLRQHFERVEGTVHSRVSNDENKIIVVWPQQVYHKTHQLFRDSLDCWA